MSTVDGFAAPGFGRVADVFAEIGAADSEQAGSAFCAVIEGDVVIDLYGGRSSPQPGTWGPDTLCALFSGSKGLLAICCAILRERAALDVGRPVATYWPEFAVQGKENVRIADVLTHRGRQPALQTAVSFDDILDPVTMANLLASQPCERAEGAGFTYHPLTMGWILAEVVRRVDGRELATFFREEVSDRLGADVYFGVPPSGEPHVATVEFASGWSLEPPPAQQSRENRAVFRAVATNPPLFENLALWNRRETHRAVIPAAGAIGTARGMATIYGALVSEDPEMSIVENSTIAEFTRPRVRGQDGLTGEPLSFGLGFQTQNESMFLGPEPDAFGHGGFGGSLHGAWPGRRTGYSFVTASLRSESPDSRPQRLLEVLHDCALSRR